MEGLVVRSTGSWYSVQTEGGNTYECKLKGRFKIKGIRTTNPIAVGDYVAFEWKDDKKIGLIHTIKERKNYIIRKSVNLSKKSHIIAANIDQAIVVITLASPRTSTGFIDRFLITTEAYHIPVVLVFNKIDLYDKELQKAKEELKSIYTNLAYRCIDVSAKEELNLDELKDIMKGKTSLFSGHSGVGKSALINALDKSKDIRVGEISEAHAKGTHTTTYAEMHHLDFGAYIIDSPGIKEFGLIDFQKQELSHYFPEMAERLQDCKFNNCTHEHEPDCAIIEAVRKGEIAFSRYENYIKILHGDEIGLEDYKN
jgi:ribosome biogenesis GTPase